MPAINAPRPVLRRYREARDLIETGDLLLFRRPRGFLSATSRLISIAGRSGYTHAGLAVRWASDRRLDPEGYDCTPLALPLVLCVEVREWYGGRAVALSNIVEAEPGRIDVYKLDPAREDEFSRAAAAEAMLRKAGRPYGWGAILNASLAHLPWVRLMSSPDFEREGDGLPEFCSDAVSNACRLAGIDPVPNLADCYTEPGDLARSACFRYEFTLT